MGFGVFLGRCWGFIDVVFEVLDVEDQLVDPEEDQLVEPLAHALVFMSERVYFFFRTMDEDGLTWLIGLDRADTEPVGVVGEW